MNKFILLLRKGVYPYEYKDSWNRFNKTSLPEQKTYSSLNMKDITNADHKHAKRVWKNFKIKSLGYYNDLTFTATNYCLQMNLKVL